MWMVVARGMLRQVLPHSIEDTALFFLFTLTILWLYTRQLALLRDVFRDWELFLAVAWARHQLGGACGGRQGWEAL